MCVTGIQQEQIEVISRQIPKDIDKVVIIIGI
jgi:hypothetical protein